MERVLALVRSEQDGQKVHLIGTSESLKGLNAQNEGGGCPCVHACEYRVAPGAQRFVRHGAVPPWVLWMMMQVPGCGEAANAEPLAGSVIRFCSCNGRLFPPTSLAQERCYHAYKECRSRPLAHACQMGVA